MVVSECPLCQSSLAEDFGLVICPSCGASLFIEMDGQVRTYRPEMAESKGLPTQFDTPVINEEEFLAEEEEFEDNSIQTSTTDSVPEDDLSEEQPPPTNLSENQELPLPEEEEGDPSLPMAPKEYIPPAGESSGMGLENMSHLADYGNSEDSLGREGPLRVKLCLSGIDSPEVREELRGALEDKKFLWNIEEIIRSIEGGVLVIENVTPLKAAILLERIKALPLDISWEQFAINQP